MRKFDYSKFERCLWDNEILRYLTQIHEHKGRQELFSRQKPVELEKLTEVAKVQSVESSNRIEGIITTSTRIGQIVKEKTTPKNRDEKEIAGYRDVLNTIHESHDYISITSNIILQLHRDLTKYSESGLGGTYKITQNYLKETRPDGSEFIRFTPVPPYETAPCIEAICENYKHAIESDKIVELYVALKYLGYEPKLCYGLVFLPNAEGEKHEIYHAWLELDGRVIDIAIYGNAKFSPYSFFDVETPICYEEYENISTIADYHPFEFDDDWKDAMLNKAVGKKITDYCDGSYRAVIWDFICDFLSIPHTEDNKLKLRSIVKGEVI